MKRFLIFSDKDTPEKLIKKNSDYVSKIFLKFFGAVTVCRRGYISIEHILGFFAILKIFLFNFLKSKISYGAQSNQ